MFTGLIQKTGELQALEMRTGSGRIIVQSPGWEPTLVKGESIAVQGVCLTLTEYTGTQMIFDVLQETFEKTNLGRKSLGARLNLERSLRVGDSIGGHYVTGHIDGIGSVKALKKVGRDWRVDITCDAELLGGMVPKGSIACDGISLTIANLTDSFFSVHIIPHTWTFTSLSSLKTGDPVNLETDVLGKYVRRCLQPAPGGAGLSLDVLKKSGFLG